MSVRFKVSFSVAFNFGPAEGDSIHKDIQRGNCGDNMAPSLVSRRSSQPQPVSGISTPCNPARPKLHRFERFQCTSMPMTVNNPESESAKAKDRDSLELLLQATSHAKDSTKFTGGDEATSSRPDDFSLVCHHPGVPSSITSEDSSASGLPVDLSFDSGSDLISSLQRLRIRGLASYFEDMERVAVLRPFVPSATLDRKCVESDAFHDVVKHGDEAGEGELGNWEEVTRSDVSSVSLKE